MSKIWVARQYKQQVDIYCEEKYESIKWTSFLNIYDKYLAEILTKILKNLIRIYKTLWVQ